MNRGYPHSVRAGQLSSPVPANQNKLIGTLLAFEPTGRRGETRIPFSPGAASKIALLARLARVNPLINWAWLAYDIYRALNSLNQWSSRTFDLNHNWRFDACAPCLPGVNFGDRWVNGYGGLCYCFPFPFLAGNPLPISVGPHPGGNILEFKWVHPTAPTNTASAAKGIWRRRDGVPTGAFISPIYQAIFLDPPVQLPYWIDPDQLPIMQPTGDPIAPPVDRRPPEKPGRLNRRKTGHGRVIRRKRLRPWEREAQQIEADVSPGTKPKTSLRANPHQLRKPPPREKEVKKKANKVLRILLRVVSGFTETLDLVEAFYLAIPFDERPKGFQSPWDKALFVYNNFDLLDPDEVIINVITDQIMDALIAMSAKQKQEVYEALGVPAGTADPNTWISKQQAVTGGNPVKRWVRAAVERLIDAVEEGTENAILP